MNQLTDILPHLKHSLVLAGFGLFISLGFTHKAQGDIKGAQSTPDSGDKTSQNANSQNNVSPCQRRANSTPEMVVIPGGTFVMGSPANEVGRDNEGPQRSVTIKGFAISRCEVTFADWQFCVDSGDCAVKYDSGWGREQRPAIRISWNDTQRYISWLNTKTGGQYRLPTEAEWEYAARAGKATRYSWGNAPSGEHANGDDVVGWPEDGYKNQTAPAASFKANPWGLYDMHGNVSEWVEDCRHSNYTGAPSDGSAWLEANGGDCRLRGIRGGSWRSRPLFLRSAYRIWGGTDQGDYQLGFRLARTLDKE